jgi:hypothetical protein
MPLASYDPTYGQTIKTTSGIPVDHSFLAHYTIDAADADAAAVDNVRVATALGVGVTTTLTVADLTQPPTPRVLSITGNAATAVGNVVVTGTDASGAVLVETIISTGAATVLGTKAFATLVTIVLPAQGAGGDTISVGLTDRFGLPSALPMNTVIAILNNATVTTVAAGSSFSATVLADNYIDPTAALNAAQIDVYYIV